jgi:ribosomal protein S18 acetylase RimI-like enzyme
MSVRLRPAVPTDAAALANVASESFVAAFGHLYRPDDLAAFLAEHKTPAVYARILSDPATRVQLAETEGLLAGYCQLQVPSEFASKSDAIFPAELKQLYCVPTMTGQGIGAALMAWALDEARALGCDAVHLSVYSENHGAQRFYARYGFAKIADIDFWVGNHRDEEFLFELRLDQQGQH